MKAWQVVEEWYEGASQNDSVALILSKLREARSNLPDQSPAFLRLDQVLLPLYTLHRDMGSYECAQQLELPGKLTVAQSPRDAALDDLLCSVFHSPSVARIVAEILGFNYLSEVRDFDNKALDEIKGILYGLTLRVVVPMCVQDFPVIKPAQAKSPALQIVMLYDTGSSLTYLTREVSKALELESQEDERLASSQTFCVKLNGQALEVGVSPMERYEHICLLGQNYMFANKLKAVIDYKEQTVSITRA